MKIAHLIVALSLVTLIGAAQSSAGSDKEGRSGEELFKENCSACHPDGGNIINPKKTLHKKDREANKVKTAEDIVGKMRNPGEGMTKFDKTMISDKDAQQIAKYIINTFK